MPEGKYNNRRAFTIENADLHVTVLSEAAGILRRAFSIREPASIRSGAHPGPRSIPLLSTRSNIQSSVYGSDARLLAGIMGHNLCLDIFGGPSAEEEAAGVTAHGEGSVVRFDINESAGQLTIKALMPLAQINFERRIELHGNAVRIRESAESLAAFDRPIGWTQHVTLGPPFLEKGLTQFRASATKSIVFETEFGTNDYLRAGAEFEWPMAPGKNGSQVDLRVMNSAPSSSGYTAHVVDKEKDLAFFSAWSPSKKLAFGYVWKRTDFPWLGIWEENHSRQASPWNGQTITRGMEFGASPFPESRRASVERGRLFGVPAFRWLPARTKLEVEYWAVLHSSRRSRWSPSTNGQADPIRSRCHPDADPHRVISTTVEYLIERKEDLRSSSLRGSRGNNDDYRRSSVRSDVRGSGPPGREGQGRC